MYLKMPLRKGPSGRGRAKNGYPVNMTILHKDPIQYDISDIVIVSLQNMPVKPKMKLSDYEFLGDTCVLVALPPIADAASRHDGLFNVS
jgi:hypothetical protein